MIHSSFHLPDSSDILYPTCQTAKRIYHFRRVSIRDAKADSGSVAIVSQIRSTTMLLMRTEGN